MNNDRFKLWGGPFEDAAMQQIRNMASLPFIHKYVAVMPDAHHGKGSTVGTVIATKGAIIPAAVGVDIGCGMQAVRLELSSKFLPDSLSDLRNLIESRVPVGFNSNIECTPSVNEALSRLCNIWGQDGFGAPISTKSSLQLGTLGGGNHFIEICEEDDEFKTLWIVIHSGSRNVGKTLAENHIDKAKGLMKSYFIDLPDPDLAYLVQGTEEFKMYLKDLLWAQAYAKENRIEMMRRVYACVEEVMGGKVGYTRKIDCHHNYTQMENHYGKNVWVTRKGAVSAKLNELGIIPGSMGTKSYIVEGLGNPESFCSCSHGAGRRMSRSMAAKIFTIDDAIKQTSGVECKKDESIIDELPMAYKDIDEVMRAQADLVNIRHTIKQILCVKG